MQLVIGSTYESSRGFGRLLYLGETHDIDGYLPTFRTTKGDLKFYGYDQLPIALVEFAPPAVSRADELIACLEGEIAKRDARIVELEARIVWLECEAQVSAAPVPEAKAQGIYSADPLACTGCKQGCFRCLSTADHVEGVRAMVAEPVQQVSVPDVSAMARTLADRNADACNVNREDNWAIYGQDYIDDVTAMLAAAPAAPAADAGLVEALSYQALFDAIAAATSVYANGAINISVQAFRAAIAAHRAQGVV